MEKRRDAWTETDKASEAPDTSRPTDFRKRERESYYVR